MKAAFIGLGIMGSRMAGNLLRNGIELTVFNRSQEAADALVNSGAVKAGSLAEAVSEKDYVFTMLSDPEAVRSIMLGTDGGLRHMKKGALWVDCSTVNPSFTLECLSASAHSGIRFMDAPVSGTKPQAENGELVFFVGGDTSLVKEVEPLLNYMGNKILHLGNTGRGTSFKMLVNSMLAQSMLIFSETMNLGEKMGFEKEFLLKTLPVLAVSPPFLKPKAERISAGNYETQFPLLHMHKDLRLVNETAAEAGVSLPMAQLAMDTYKEAIASGLGNEDFSAIYKYITRSPGR